MHLIRIAINMKLNIGFGKDDVSVLVIGAQWCQVYKYILCS